MGRKTLLTSQHLEGDEGVVEVETTLRALLEPPESKSTWTGWMGSKVKLKMRSYRLTSPSGPLGVQQHVQQKDVHQDG